LRTLDEHKVNPANDQLQVLVVDEPGAGGASHLYRIDGFSSETNVSSPYEGLYGEPATHAHILFQNGPIAETGVNGLTHEVLLAILVDRLRSFQAGPYACVENHNALDHVEHALFHLRQRTLKRVARGVEGTHTV
jgi:hypothetical protein